MSNLFFDPLIWSLFEKSQRMKQNKKKYLFSVPFNYTGLFFVSRKSFTNFEENNIFV